ncbi:MAG: hypothetical protein ACKOA0_05045 [Burkholderiaceae bacterium]
MKNATLRKASLINASLGAANITLTKASTATRAATQPVC